MALVRFGALVQAVSGRLGGLCFSRQGGSSIVRTQPVVKPKASDSVRATQAAMVEARAMWSDMTAVQRATWDNAAAQWKRADRVGRAKGGTGYTLFCGTAVRQLLAWVGVGYYAGNGYHFTMGVPVTVEVWPGGPMEVYTDHDRGTWIPFITVRAQRFVSTSSGKPGRMWRVIGRNMWSYLSVDVWGTGGVGRGAISPGLAATFGAPGRGEWIRAEVEQWVPGYGPTTVTSHLVQIPNCGNELVVNGTFYTGGTPPAGWAVVAPGVLEQQVVNTYGDAKSGRWHVAAGGGFTQFFTASGSTFALVAGASYTLRYAYKTVVGNLWRIIVTQSGIGVTVIDAAPPVTAGVWIRRAVTFTCGYNFSAALLAFQGYTNAATDVWLDNVSLRKDVY